LKWLSRQGKNIKGSVLNVGSGHDQHCYRRFFPHTTRFRNLDKAGFAEVNVVADVQDMPQIPSKSEDCIVAFFMLYQVPDVEAALREFRRVLKPNGVLLATFSNKYGSNRVHKFTKTEVFRLVKNYFDLEDLEEYKEKGEFICAFIKAIKRE